MKRAARSLAFVLVLVAVVAGAAVYVALRGEPDVSGPAASPSAMAGSGGGGRRNAVPAGLPALAFVDGRGEPRTLNDFKGRAVLLNIWATWCTPCRKEMPALDRLQKMLGGSAFEVVALSIDRGGTVAVQSFYDEIDVQALAVYVDANAEALTKLGSVGIPLTVLIDRQGRELWRVIGPAEWDQPASVNRILASLPELGRR